MLAMNSVNWVTLFPLRITQSLGHWCDAIDVCGYIIHDYRQDGGLIMVWRQPSLPPSSPPWAWPEGRWYCWPGAPPVASYNLGFCGFSFAYYLICWNGKRQWSAADFAHCFPHNISDFTAMALHDWYAKIV
jgi:hypothetical protein